MRRSPIRPENSLETARALAGQLELDRDEAPVCVHEREVGKVAPRGDEVARRQKLGRVAALAAGVCRAQLALGECAPPASSKASPSSVRARSWRKLRTSTRGGGRSLGASASPARVTT